MPKSHALAFRAASVESPVGPPMVATAPAAAVVGPVRRRTIDTVLMTTGPEAEAYASYIGHAAVEEAAAISGQRNSLFKGETLRGLLLSTFAWSTIGRIAGVAAMVAFVAAAGATRT